MKKTFFLLIISLISLNLFAEGKITYNKNIKNPKTLLLIILIIHIRIFMKTLNI